MAKSKIKEQLTPLLVAILMLFAVGSYFFVSTKISTETETAPVIVQERVWERNEGRGYHGDLYSRRTVIPIVEDRKYPDSAAKINAWLRKNAFGFLDNDNVQDGKYDAPKEKTDDEVRRAIGTQLKECTHSHDFDVNYEVEYNKNSLFCIRKSNLRSFARAGGNGSRFWKETLMMNIETGETYEYWEKLFKKPDVARKRLNDCINELILSYERTANESRPDKFKNYEHIADTFKKSEEKVFYRPMDRDYETKAVHASFYIDENALVLYYNPSHDNIPVHRVEGIIEFPIPKGKIKDLLVDEIRDKWFQDA
ncbi:MAG: RsiV family protein [Acidaminococcales bacterium]|jgi:hypothetical protein|nr:RsiV family protein [Acidaminococcales bacterium]